MAALKLTEARSMVKLLHWLADTGTGHSARSCSGSVSAMDSWIHLGFSIA
jgi:hypothetical protein